MKTFVINSKKHGTHSVFLDDEDYEMLSSYRWYIQKQGRNFYAERRIRIIKENKKTTQAVKMHRVILGLGNFATDPRLVDHKDGNGLNNVKSNLRIATNSQNSKNRKAAGKSKYLGVSLVIRTRQKSYWLASIKVDGKQKHIKSFPYTPEGEILAAKAYNEAAIKYHGEFANLNIFST